MSPEARQRIAEGLRKSAQAKAIAKAAQGAIPSTPLQSPAPEGDHSEDSAMSVPVEAVADAQVVVSAPQEPAEAPVDVPVADRPRESKASRRAAKTQ
jgi:hypothetical protein